MALDKTVKRTQSMANRNDFSENQPEHGCGPEAAVDWRRRTRDCEGLGLKLETGSDRTQVGLFAETLKSVGVLSS